MDNKRILMTALAAVALSVPVPALAESVEDFYRGRTLSCLIGYGPGGGYDVYARTICRHMSKHIPGNPQFIPQNMPGASSMVLANHLAHIAPKDGTVIGAVNAALLFDYLFKGEETDAQFQGPDFTMIGNAVSSAAVLVSWHTSGIATMDDLREGELIVGATSPSGDTYLLPLAFKRALGLEDNIRFILGYPGTNEAAQALESGEISGRSWDMEGIKASRPHWLEDGSIKILAQLAPHPMPEVPGNVPLALDLVEVEDDRRALEAILTTTILQRPYIAPPGIPQDRAQALRDAFWATMEDPEFLAEMAQLSLTVDPMSGEQMQEVVENAYDLPDALVERIRAMLIPET